MQQQQQQPWLRCQHSHHAGVQEQEAGAVGSGAKRRGGYRSRRGETPVESAVESYPKLAPGGVLVEGGSCEEGTHLHSQAGPI